MPQNQVVIRSLSFSNPNEHPTNLHPGQIAFNLSGLDKYIYLGDGSDIRVTDEGEDLSGNLIGETEAGMGWVRFPLKGGVTSESLSNRDTSNRDRANHMGEQESSTISDWETSLSGRSNTTHFTPTSDYHPATKKYVDELALESQIDADRLVNGSVNYIFSLGEKNKLSLIEEEATANDSDSNLRDRANHTGQQSSTTISDWSTTLAGKSNTTPFTPTSPHHPATKKYVDDLSVSSGSYTDSQAEGAVGGILSSEFTYDEEAPEIRVNSISADKIVDGMEKKAFTLGEKTKLAGITSGATVNDSNASLRNRVTHTGTQDISTVTDLQASLEAKAPLASPTFTGAPAAPTASAGTNTTQLATTAFVKAAIDAPTSRPIIAISELNVDCSLGNYFTKTINANSTFTFSNSPPSVAYGFVLQLTHTSGTITWPASVKWSGNTAPTLATGKTHLFFFSTTNGGSSWQGSYSIDYN